MDNKNKVRLGDTNMLFIVPLYCWVTIFFSMILLAIKVIFLNFIMFASFASGWKFAFLLYLIVGVIPLIGLFIISLLYFFIRFIQEKVVETNVFLRVIMYALGALFSWLLLKNFFINLQDTNQLSDGQMLTGSVVSFIFILFLDYLYYNKFKFFKKRRN